MKKVFLLILILLSAMIGSQVHAAASQAKQEFIAGLYSIVSPSNIHLLYLPAPNERSTTKELSSYARTGTYKVRLKRPDYSVLGNGVAAHFTTSNYLLFPSDAGMVFGNGTQDKSFSVIAIFREHQWPGGEGETALIQKYEDASDREWGFFITSPNGKTALFLQDQVNGGYLYPNASPSMNLERWYSYTGTYAGNSLTSGIKLYENGVDRTYTGGSSSRGTYVAMSPGTIPLSINGQIESPDLSVVDNSMDGDIALICLVAGELSPQQIADLQTLYISYFGSIF